MAPCQEWDCCVRDVDVTPVGRPLMTGFVEGPLRAVRMVLDDEGRRGSGPSAIRSGSSKIGCASQPPTPRVKRV